MMVSNKQTTARAGALGMVTNERHSDSDFTVDYWEANWDRVKLPAEHSPSKNREMHRIFSRYLPRERGSLCEIGCAPGGWLAYFAKHFAYKVSGIEYAPKAYEKTLENLRILNIPAQVHHADFFAIEPVPNDVVFSYGFIEHYADVQSVLKRVVSFARPAGGLVITCVPALSGLNWWISRTFRPKVAAGHFPITLTGLTAVHEAAGLQTLCARWSGTFQVLPPVAKNRFARKHPCTTRVINFPFKLWNKGGRVLKNTLNFYPQCESIHTHLVYIGKRR